MSAGTEDVSLLDPYQSELTFLSGHSPNVLLEGPVAATDIMLVLLRPYLRELLIRNLPHTPLELPERADRSVVLRDVASLTADDQAPLLRWLQGAGSRTQ